MGITSLGTASRIITHSFNTNNLRFYSSVYIVFDVFFCIADCGIKITV
jgi:hypothetical protein